MSAETRPSISDGLSGKTRSASFAAPGGQRRSSRSRAFLLELVLNMLVFALCATIALQIFALSKTEIDKSRALTKLSIQAESLAETFKAAGGQPQDFGQALGQELSFGSVLTWYYDADLVEIDAGDAAAATAAYTLECSISQQEDCQLAAFAAYAQGEQLLSFTVFCYAAQGGTD